MICPICSIRRATSTHHIKPTNDGGSDNHKNKVTLCKLCHDIVEEVYSNTGLELSSQVVKLIKLEYNFPIDNIDRDIDMSIRATSLYRLRRKYKFYTEKKVKIDIPDGAAMRCPYCRKWHFPGRRGLVVCPMLKNMTTQAVKAETSYSMLMEKIRKVRLSIE